MTAQLYMSKWGPVCAHVDGSVFFVVNGLISKWQVANTWSILRRLNLLPRNKYRHGKCSVKFTSELLSVVNELMRPEAHVLRHTMMFIRELVPRVLRLPVFGIVESDAVMELIKECEYDPVRVCDRSAATGFVSVAAALTESGSAVQLPSGDLRTCLRVSKKSLDRLAVHGVNDPSIISTSAFNDVTRVACRTGSILHVDAGSVTKHGDGFELADGFLVVFPSDSFALKPELVYVDVAEYVERRTITTFEMHQSDAFVGIIDALRSKDDAATLACIGRGLLLPDEDDDDPGGVRNAAICALLNCRCLDQYPLLARAVALSSQ